MNLLAIPSRLTNEQRKVVGLMVGLSVMSYFDRTIMSIAGPGIMKEFSLSETEMGAVYSAFTFSYALLMIPGGQLADRYGPRWVLTFSALGAALFTALTAMSGKPGLGSILGIIPAFVVIRLGLGVWTAPLYPACARMNANWIPEYQRARVQGFIASGAGIGGAVSPLLFSWSVAHYGWRLSFVMAAAVTAALGLVWFWSVRDTPSEHHSNVASLSRSTTGAALTTGQPPSTRWKSLLTNYNLILLTVGYFAVDYFEYIFFYWIYYYFGAVRKIGAGESAFLTTLLFLTWTLMTPLGGGLSDRLVVRYGRKIGRKLVPIIGLPLSAILLIIGINLSNTTAMVALLSLALGLASCSEGPFWAAAIEVTPKQDVGAACGILNTGGNIGGFLAPLLTPYIAARAGWSWGLYFGSLVLLLAVVAWFFVNPARTIEDSQSRG